MIKSQHGTREQAKALQEQNGVPSEQAGAWFHGAQRQISEFTNKRHRVTWFTRSARGGIAWGPTVTEVWIIQSLDDPHFADCGAGDPDGKDPEHPDRGLPNWWLKVMTSEIDKVLVVASSERAPAAKDVKTHG